MISLKLQIYSILFTFLYGIFCSFLVNLFYTILFYKKNTVKIIGTFVFSLFLALLYFFLLKIINYGYIHLYFLFLFCIGFFSSFAFFKRKIRK